MIFTEDTVGQTSVKKNVNRLIEERKFMSHLKMFSELTRLGMFSPKMLKKAQREAVYH